MFSVHWRLKLTFYWLALCVNWKKCYNWYWCDLETVTYKRNTKLALVSFSWDNFPLILSTRENQQIAKKGGGRQGIIPSPWICFHVVLQAELMIIFIVRAGNYLWPIENSGKQPKLWSKLTGVGETDFFARTAEMSLSCSCLLQNISCQGPSTSPQSQNILP